MRLIRSVEIGKALVGFGDVWGFFCLVIKEVQRFLEAGMLKDVKQC